MKLVDILARELKAWPEGIVTAVQDHDGELKFDDSPDHPHLTEDGLVWLRHGVGGGSMDYFLDIATDRATAIITRAQWQAAVDALAAQDMHDSAVNAQDRDGVILHTDKSHPTTDFSDMIGELKGSGSTGSTFNAYKIDFSEGFQSCCLDTRPVIAGIVDPDTQWNGEGLPPVDLECEVMGGGLPSTAFDWERCTILLINEGADGKSQVCTRDFRGDLAIYYPEVDSVYFRPIRTAEQIAADERKLGIDEMYIHGIDAGDSTIEYTCAALWDAGYRKK